MQYRFKTTSLPGLPGEYNRAPRKVVPPKKTPPPTPTPKPTKSKKKKKKKK